LIEYVRAVKGQAQNIKETLPFLCPDVGYVEKMLSDSKAVVILAKDKSNIVGVVGGWLEGIPSEYKDEDKILREHGAYSEAHLDWIAVKEEYRERGVGANLVQKVCDWARKEKIWVEASKDKAEFYEKQSLMLIGRFIGEKEEELSTMLKQL
jgi:ribosomal protein S18 acetylase RimI-like enzyme